MALVKASLKSAITAIQSSKPTSVVAAATQWSNAIFAYSSAGMAGVTVPTLNAAALKSLFLASMNSKKWMEKLGADLVTWWTPVPWAGPGFTGVTIVAPPLNSKPIGNRILNGEDAATVLSNEIDIWTKTVKVTLTNTNSGATSTAPVI